MAIVLHANAYFTGRSYGGPEDGGWWYDTGVHLLSVAFPADELPFEVQNDRSVADPDYRMTFDETARETARRTVRELCTLAGYDTEKRNFSVFIEDHPGLHFPQERQSYE